MYIGNYDDGSKVNRSDYTPKENPDLEKITADDKVNLQEALSLGLTREYDLKNPVDLEYFRQDYFKVIIEQTMQESSEPEQDGVGIGPKDLDAIKADDKVTIDEARSLGIITDQEYDLTTTVGKLRFMHDYNRAQLENIKEQEAKDVDINAKIEGVKNYHEALLERADSTQTKKPFGLVEEE